MVECLTRDDVDRARGVIEHSRALRLGLAEASFIVLAERHGTTRMLTVDERAYRAVAPLQGGTFTVLSADAA